MVRVVLVERYIIVTGSSGSSSVLNFVQKVPLFLVLVVVVVGVMRVLELCCNRLLLLLEKILKEDASRLEDRDDNRHITITVICLWHIMTCTR